MTKLSVESSRTSQFFMALVLLMRIIIVASVPLLLVIGSVRLIMNPVFLQFEYTRPGFPVDSYGFSVDDRLDYGPYGIAYIFSAEGIDFLGELRLPVDLCFGSAVGAEDCPMFNERELGHMQDVKQVTAMAFAAGLALFAMTLLCAVTLWRSQKLYILKNSLVQGAIFSLSLIATVITVAIAAWDTFFDTFHAAFFASGTWRFFYSDTLIRLYPQQFWFDAALLIGIMTTSGALIILGAVWAIRKRN